MGLVEIVIRSKVDNSVLLSGKYGSVKNCLEKNDDANLRGADLNGANLRDANLSGAYLHGTYLSGASLRDAYLNGANLNGANLSDANLHGANLHGASLYGADLRGADLHGADLSGADLRDANLHDANLRDAYLDFSQLQLSCRTLAAKFDNRIVIQILYHAAKVTENNENIDDKDLVELLKNERFVNVVNKFHRVDECGKFVFGGQNG